MISLNQPSKIIKRIIDGWRTKNWREVRNIFNGAGQQSNNILNEVCHLVQNIVSSAVSSAFSASALSGKNFHNYSSIILFD